MTAASPPPSDERALRAIALFKLLKAGLLVAAGLSAVSLLRASDPSHRLLELVHDLRLAPDNRFVHRAIAAVSALDTRRLEELSVGTFVYAAVFAVEGVGLWLRRHWAEYLTTGVTASLVPLELYELWRGPSAAKLAGIALNVAIVWFLAARLTGRSSRTGGSPAPRRRLS